MELYILGLAGVLLHFLTKLLEARRTKTKLDWVVEMLASVISIIIVVVLVYVKDDMEKFYPLTSFTSVGLGYSAQSILRAVIKATQPKI